ncbi:MAG: hypothetical protein RML12_05610 [Xanthomonadales bacterium]|nr:hypothetical protein [Xanthomonadales bacterium]
MPTARPLLRLALDGGLVEARARDRRDGRGGLRAPATGRGGA